MNGSSIRGITRIASVRRIEPPTGEHYFTGPPRRRSSRPASFCPEITAEPACQPGRSRTREMPINPRGVRGNRAGFASFPSVVWDTGRVKNIAAFRAPRQRRSGRIPGDIYDRFMYLKEPQMVGRSLHREVSALAVGAVLALAGTAQAADQAKQVTFSKDVAPIFQAKCQSCHEPGSIAPMSLITYRGSAARGRKSIKARVVDAPDAAVAHRPQRRHSEVQERHVADRRAGRDDRRLGRSGRAAGQPGRHADAQAGRRRPCTGRPSATATDRPTSS